MLENLSRDALQKSLTLISIGEKVFPSELASIIAGLASQQEALNEFIFAEFGAAELNELTGKLAALKKRLAKACLKVAVDF